MINSFETVIGLEVHCQLKSRSKLFCTCSAQYSGAEPNTHVCPVCLGHPGVLPVFNKEVLELALKACLALSCQVPAITKFDRKHYFYPDLPKAYQITQFDEPIGEHGNLELKGEGDEVRQIPIRRIHIEEDAGKTLHTHTSGSLVDYNRCSVPLLEIVTDPDLKNSKEAKDYLETLRKVLRTVDVSDCDMENGTLRCDVNLSVRKRGESQLGIRVEIKNLNSFRSVVRAIEYEELRHVSLLEAGKRIERGTLLWDEEAGKTRLMRSKETEDDYRYFPDPDLPPIKISRELIKEVISKLPELPLAREKRFVKQYGISSYNASLLCEERDFADFFEEACAMHANPNSISNWILTEFLRELNRSDTCISESLLKPAMLAQLVKLIDEGTISGKIAKNLFPEMIASGHSPEELVEKSGLSQISDDESLRKHVHQVLESNPHILDDLKAGKKKALGFLMGQIMKATGGKANPQKVQVLLHEILEEVHSIRL